MTGAYRVGKRGVARLMGDLFGVPISPAGVCASLRGIEAGLYTFATTAGVEPTNNAAVRAVRHAVCWRKTSGGTDGASSSGLVERVLTVVASCRQQNRDVLAVLTEAVLAARTGATPPSHVPAGA